MLVCVYINTLVLKDPALPAKPHVVITKLPLYFVKIGFKFGGILGILRINSISVPCSSFLIGSKSTIIV